MILFVTNSAEKFGEFYRMLPSRQLKIELPEIQSLNPQEIIVHKLEAAIRHIGDTDERLPLAVEDTSLNLRCLNGLPGPLVKWFLRAIGDKGIADLVYNYTDSSAIATSIIGYMDSSSKISFHYGETNGTIVAPRGKPAFGFDDIFMPHGYSVTYSEMEPWRKDQSSPRKKAIMSLQGHLTSK